MVLEIYDTLSRKKKAFEPIGKVVKMFVCGPTVYDYAHIGHARSYINFDIVARYLKWKGHKLNYLQNITDIDDKIIKRANESNRVPKDLAKEFENKYCEDMRALNVTSVNIYARASDNIKEIINQIQRLLKKDFAYQINDGVYFDISKFKDYGKLSQQNLEQLKEHRIEPNLQKKNPCDFSLWKRHKEGEPFWPSPFGNGRPGWHIEDTAITEKYFGPQYDIHGGGIDLIFPHHECEIAQIESVSGKKPLVNYWMHNEFLVVDNEKMAKSLGNFVTIRDALKNNKPQTLRLFFAATHYRQPINYSEENLRNTNAVYEKFTDFVLKLQNIREKSAAKVDAHASRTSSAARSEAELRLRIEKVKKDFESAMDDDFNIALALKVIFDFMTEINKLIDTNKLNSAAAKKVYKFILDLDNVLGLNLNKIKEEKLPAEFMKLIKQREAARKNKDWKASDRIRNELEEKGILLEDLQGGGTRWKVIK